ncbi:MAG: type II toxin-antitoxin system VapC family toxin [Desulfobacterales bacterium]|nr:type II toxin-antitoxin system VapC family toxin [Desulfobacterales bacterium]
MKGIDTNLLVRFLVGDNEHQTKKVYNIFKKAESSKQELFVPLLIVLELIWVLESAYEIPRNEILDSISELLLMPILKFEQQSTLQQFTIAAQGNRYDLSDLLIAHSAKFHGCDAVLTFDKKASKFSLFEMAE